MSLPRLSPNPRRGATAPHRHNAQELRRINLVKGPFRRPRVAKISPPLSISRERTMKPLEALTAQDIMSSPVIALDVDTSLAEAARVLSEQQVSGALVVDHRGAAVGVVSLFDIVTHMAGLARTPEQAGGFYRYSYPRSSEEG